MMHVQTITDKDGPGFTRTIWLFNCRLSLSLGYFPMWPRPVWNFHENGGRHPGECFDATLNLCRLSFGLTIWRIGAFHWPLKLLPGGRSRSGLSIGIFPRSD
jgi:hypothetical protein